MNRNWKIYAIAIVLAAIALGSALAMCSVGGS